MHGLSMCLSSHFTLDLPEGSGAVHKPTLCFLLPDFVKKEKLHQKIYIEVVPKQKNLMSESLKKTERKEINSRTDSSAYIKSHSAS